MPLSEHEQQILEDIERGLTEEDPRFAHSVSRQTLYTHLAIRIRWATVGFVAGFLLLLLYVVSIWIALAGFALMLASAFIAYRALKQIGQDQLRLVSHEGRFSLPLFLARVTGRYSPGSGPVD